MRSTIDCIPCYFRQALSVVRRVTDNEGSQLSVFKKVAEIISRLSLEASPAENTYRVLKTINEVLGCQDPFKEEKKKYNSIAMAMYPKLCDIARHSKNSLYTSAKIAVAGNIIDLGILKSFDISGTLNKLLKDGFAIDHFDQFKQTLNNAKHILYLADNTGEIVFDKVFIEQLLKYCKVTVAVNKGPILNDATSDDALMTGLDKVTEIINTGTDTVGKHPDKSSAQFQKIFHSADLIIAKGHGNYEILDQTNFNIFFLLQAKCDTVARNLGVKCWESVLLKNPNHIKK